MPRTVVAFLLAPLATPLTIWLAFTVFYLTGFGWFAGKRYDLVLGNVRMWCKVATPLAYAMTLVGGIPATLVFRKRGWTGLRHFVALGTVLGVLPFLAVDGYFAVVQLARRAHKIEMVFPWLLIGMGALCGICSATAFWCLAIYPKRKQSRLP